VTVHEIREAAKLRAATFATAEAMRQLLDEVLDRYPADDRSEAEELVQELVFGEAP